MGKWHQPERGTADRIERAAYVALICFAVWVMISIVKITYRLAWA